MKVKVIFDATKANDEYIAKVYSMILEQASSVSKQRADMFTKMMSHKTIKNLFGKEIAIYTTSIEKIMNGIGQKVITDFDRKVNPVFKTFLANSLKHLIRSSMKQMMLNITKH